MRITALENNKTGSSMAPIHLRKKGKLHHQASALRQALITAGIFLGALMLAVLAFISLELAGLAAGFMALCGFIALEIQRRQNWELSSSFKFKMMGENHDALVREVARNRNDIGGLKEGIASLANTIEKITDDMPAPSPEEFVFLKRLADTMDEIGNKPRSPASNSLKPDPIDQFTVMPRALKPGVPMHDDTIPPEPADDFPQSSLVANDDPFGDHASLSDMVVQELVHNAVRQGRIDVFAQPILRLPSRQPVAYELFARIRARAGLYIPAEQYMKMARHDNLTADIDTLLLTTCLQSIIARAKDDSSARFFINIEPASLKSGKFMNGLLAFVTKNRDMAKRIAFELHHEAFKTLAPPLLKIMEGLARLGCAFSLDHITGLDFDLRHLQRYNVRYIKINGARILAQSKTEAMFTDFWRRKNKLEANGVAVIADKIERDVDLKELLDFNLNFGQGYLFGKPDLLGAYRPFAHAKTFAKRQGGKETFS